MARCSDRVGANVRALSPLGSSNSRTPAATGTQSGRSCTRLIPLGGIMIAMVGYSDNKAAVQKRLRRIEGQVRGIQRMVDEDTYCIEVLTQISAATRALQAVALQLLD